MEELHQASLNGITSEVIKKVVNDCPKTIMGSINKCLQKRTFPDRWKVTTLVLIQKRKSDNSKTRDYRPICLLDSMGKLLESMIRNRLEREIEEKGDGVVQKTIRIHTREIYGGRGARGKARGGRSE